MAGKRSPVSRLLDTSAVVHLLRFQPTPRTRLVEGHTLTALAQLGYPACSGTATNASPARTMSGSRRSTQPLSPTVAAASRPRRAPVPGSILKTETRRPASTPSRWKRVMIRSSANRKVKQGSSYSGLMLLTLRPHPHVTVVINLDVYDVRATADRAILGVLLARP